MTWQEQMFSTLASVAGVIYTGVQESPRKGNIILFTERTTESTFGVWENDLSVPAINHGKGEVIARFAD